MNTNEYLDRAEAARDKIREKFAELGIANSSAQLPELAQAAQDMPNRGAIHQTIAPGGTVKIPEGWHNGEGEVTAEGAAEVKLQSKSVTPTKATQTVRADASFDGLEEVEVKPIPDEYIQPTGMVTIKKDGVYDATNWKQATIQAAANVVQPALQSKTVTPLKVYQGVRPDSGYYGLSEVGVQPIPDEYIKPSGTVQVTSNGEHDVRTAEKVNVQVPAPAPKTQEKSVTPGVQPQTVQPDSGFDGLSKVTVAGDAELVPENIRQGVEIFGVAGALAEGGGGGSGLEYEDVVAYTYTVDAVSGASYGFAQNNTGYWESQNKGIQSSYALCRVNFNVQMPCNITFDVINYAEGTYDYGLMGNVDEALGQSASADSSVYKNFSGEQSASVVKITYKNVPAGSHFIDVKFIKDNSQDRNNDSLKFKVHEAPVERVFSEETIRMLQDADSDFVPDNVKKGVNLFGLDGSYEGEAGAVVGGNISYGEVIASADNQMITVQHGLGAIPRIVVWYEMEFLGAVTTGTKVAGSILIPGELAHWSYKSKSGSYAEEAPGSTSANANTAYVVSNLTDSSFESPKNLVAGKKYLWIAIA